MMTCPRCDGDGRYKGRTSYGPECFRCGGSGKVRQSRERKAPVLPDYVSIESLCIDWNSPHDILNRASAQTVDYYGGRAYFEGLAEGWDAGYREVRNRTANENLPRFR